MTKNYVQILMVVCLWVEIHQALLSQFSHLAKHFFGKLPVNDQDDRI